MRPAFSLVLLLSILLALSACRKNEPETAEAPLTMPTGEKLMLPNGWSISPAGKQVALEDFPMHAALSPSGDYLAVLHAGQSYHGLYLVDTRSDAVVQTLSMPKAWLGLSWSADGSQLYASGGHDNIIRRYAFSGGQLVESDSIPLGYPWPQNKISPAGIAVNDAAGKLYTVTKEDKQLYICDIKTSKVLKKMPLPSEGYTCLLAADGRTLYVSAWGAEQVLFFDTQTETFTREVKVGSHPNDMVLSPDGQRLFVANANDNSVSVIRTSDGKVLETIIASLYPDAPTGSTSNSVAIDAEGKTLYIANADNNCLAVIDVSEAGESRSLGFIPTGWYPTAVKVHNNRLLVVNGKGLRSVANPNGPNPYIARSEETEYIARMLKGTLSVIPQPSPGELKTLSRMVYENTPYNEEQRQQAHAETGNPIPQKTGDPSPIKYVFYIVKENRTYDQVLGDLPQGNGDPALCLFPDSVTPNQHALAQEFVLLDNFYVNAEVSADGHNWSAGGYANDYVEKTWPTSYGGRGGSYDYEGSKTIAYPKAGFIWDYCRRAGVSYRSYGWFSNLNETHLESLKGQISPKYPGYNLSIKDTARFNIWAAEFDSLVAAGALPRFNTVRFGNDHTAGTRQGMPTPSAMVADNDLAVGLFVEHLSKSPVWAESVVFILEDDAQNGPDHVDAHRSIAFVAGPHVKRGFVDHTMYTTTGMLRTIELILGLPPMSQYDAAATPMHNCFTAAADTRAFAAKANRIDLNQLNPGDVGLIRLSEGFDFSREDAIPDHLFSEAIWKAVRGFDSVMPAPVHSAFVVRWEESEEEEEGED